MLLAELTGRPDFHSYTYLGTYFYRFNVSRPPFDNPLVRKALSAAIDRERITRKITRAGEEIATAFTPHGISGYTPPDGIGFNPEQAKTWLAEAGYPNGSGFPRFGILYNKSDLHEKIALEIQDMWKQTLGVNCELKNQEWASYLQTLRNLDYDVARSSWIGDYVDPNTFLDCFITLCRNMTKKLLLPAGKSTQLSACRSSNQPKLCSCGKLLPLLPSTTTPGYCSMMPNA